MLVLFGDSDPESPEAWPTTHRQVRATAEPNLDAWVADLLPDPATVACACTYEVRDDEGAVVSEGGYGVTLADLGLSPLDLLAVVEGGVEAQQSELEQRVRYHLARERGLPENATVELTFRAVSEWDHDVRTLDGLSSLDGLVSFGEVLAAVEPASDLVSTGRPADARDLREPASAGGRNRDADALRTRANAVVGKLAGADADLGRTLAVLEPDEDGRDDLTGLDAVGDAVAALPPSDVTLDGLAADLDGVDSAAVRAAVGRLADALAAGLVSLATVDGEVRLEPTADATVEGVVAAEQGTELGVRLRASGSQPLLLSADVTVERGGRFAADFDLSAVPEGTAFSVTVHGPNGTVGQQSGTVVSSVEETPSVAPGVGPVSVPALTAFAETARTLRRVGDAARPLREALARTDFGPLRTLDAEIDWSAVRQRDDWDDAWPADLTDDVDDLLALPPVALPGFDHEDLSAGAWRDLLDAVEALASGAGTDLLAYESEELSELGDALGRVADREDAAVEQTLDAALGSAASSLRDLDALTGTASAAVSGFRLGTFETVRDALMAASHFGVGASVPQVATGYGEDARETLTRQAAAVADEVSARLADAPADSGAADPDAETELARIETVFEESFTVLAPFAPTNPTELGSALSVSHSDSLQNRERNPQRSRRGSGETPPSGTLRRRWAGRSPAPRPSPGRRPLSTPNSAVPGFGSANSPTSRTTTGWACPRRGTTGDRRVGCRS
ncbi:BGTF surface domain-containing protein [Halorussus caseinilyticus]|uniref:BGTF surface domain-containing protein n=1 Tax=Halorussus caseinilyticus TaxID=3034025 RepID=A0ABD5WL69_9EURY